MIEQIITSSVLIAAMLILSFFMEKRVNPCLKYALWLLIVVKLLIPLPAFQSNISVMNIVNQIDEEGVRYLFIDNETEGVNETPGRESTYLQTENSENISNRMLPKIEIVDICYFVWMAGMLVCAGMFVWSNLRFFQKVRSSRVSIEQYKNKLNVYTADGITGPCLFGLFSPSVYLQKNRELSGEQREYVLAHEYIHYRHGDHVWALVRCICVILYWYNPLVWLAACVSIKDSELACDFGTLKLVGQEKYKEYGKTLIEIAKGTPGRFSKYHVLECPTSVIGGGKELKKRMRMIVKQPRTKLVSLLVLLLACISIAGFTFGSAVDNRNAEDALTGNDNTITLDDLPDYSSEEEKEAAYYNMLEYILSLQIEEIAGTSDCVIEITESDSGLQEVHVRMTIDNSFDEDLDDIQANIAQALNIPAESVKIFYKK